jgi:hypothetical protein
MGVCFGFALSGFFTLKGRKGFGQKTNQREICSSVAMGTSSGEASTTVERGEAQNDDLSPRMRKTSRTTTGSHGSRKTFVGSEKRAMAPGSYRGRSNRKQNCAEAKTQTLSQGPHKTDQQRSPEYRQAICLDGNSRKGN